ncbi:hypothetical protein E5D57_009377 [Metarhizium anisopliae]|nr:hypothetical protein E5D57_009377 [Metarhizium anisopliae]
MQAGAAPPPRVNDAQQPSAPRRDESETRPKTPSRTLGRLTNLCVFKQGTGEWAPFLTDALNPAI